ncbi:hypothetical protein FB451DRAFT_1407733 [Mycena latifolia]|nr:hypothetical protein FB451DRAFT_1407733 [Mycena latifolia]
MIFLSWTLGALAPSCRLTLIGFTVAIGNGSRTRLHPLRLYAPPRPIRAVPLRLRALPCAWHTWGTLELSRWAGVICALAFFAFFGFAAEAHKNRRLPFWAVATRCGVKQPADGKLPIHLPWSKAKSSSAAS